MNFHAPIRSFRAELAQHYAEVRARLGGLPVLPEPILLLLPPPVQYEPAVVLDLVPDQRGKVAWDVVTIGTEAEVIAARRALMIYARLREESPGLNCVRHLQTAIIVAFKIDLWVLLGDSRRRGPSRIRHIALMLAHCVCATSREDVSRRFNRNHATVHYAEKKFAGFLDGATSQIGGA